MTSTSPPAGSNAARKPPAPVCMPKMNPFFANMAIYQDMGKRLQTNVDFLLALSSMESGWLNAHNQGLHNLFGVTKAGGNNLNFPTYQAAADFWVKTYSPYVQGSATIDDFIAGLKTVGYNSVNPNYYGELKKQVAVVQKYKTACGY